MTTPRTHPLLRSAPEVRALLAGATQFMVPLKPQPVKIEIGGIAYRLPWAPGDLLAVKETWASAGKPCVAYRATGECGAWNLGAERFWIHHGWVVCDGAPAPPSDGRSITSFGLARFGNRWRPSTTMPRWASRLTLRVTDVRVQRVQDATPGDACAEGVTETGYFDEAERLVSAGATMPAERLALALQWDATHGKRPGLSFADNPWAVATTAERVEAPHD